MMDVLYGEEVRPRLCFEFFEHLSGCVRCRQEYIELVETREMLAEWEPEEMVGEIVGISQNSISSGKLRPSLNWWPLSQKVAAGILIAVGAYTVFQAVGIVPARATVTVSEAQLTEVIHDVTLARQMEDWHEIGKALLSLKEEIEAKNRLTMHAVYEDMQTLEQRYVHALEESNQNVRTLMGQ
jgi:hypothetical protein